MAVLFQSGNFFQMTRHKRLEEEEVVSQITHVRSDSPYVNGDNSNRPSSRQHVGTEIAFHDVCYVVPVKEKGERHLKSLLNRVRFVKLRFPLLYCSFLVGLN